MRSRRSSTSLCDESMSSSSSDNATVPNVTAAIAQKSQDKNDSVDFIFREPPDITFVVNGTEFPCHSKILSMRCHILSDIALVTGVQKQISKKQRIEPQAREQDKEERCLQRPVSHPPSVITIVELNVDPRIFQAILEFLYSNELPSGWYWDDEEEEASSLVTDDEAFDNEDDDDVTFDESHCKTESYKPLSFAMDFLQRLLITAGRFGIVSLKHEIEHKLYDEFLYTFTAAELFVWADTNSCAFLKEKAMDRICKTSNSADDFEDSNSRWKMIRESKRLLEELFVYASVGCHEVRYFHYDALAINHKANQKNYYKVEYLRKRLSDLDLDTDGTREDLEERLRPHLDDSHSHFLPTRLTKLSEQNTRFGQLRSKKSCGSRKD